MAVKSLDELEHLATRVFVKSNVSENNAVQVARALVAAEADGMPSHGLSRVPSYADQALSGKVDGKAIPRLERTALAALRVDAKGGYAYPAINLGMAQAVTLARETGIVGLGVANSHHAGVAAHPVEAAARAGMIAMAFLNSPAAMAPWGGNRAIFGTNPIAFACPRPSLVQGGAGGGYGDPVVVDLSLSKVARGKIMMASKKGEPIPEGWAVDKDGKPTTDAKAALGGAMLPMGDARGAALVLAVEILAATLTGSNHGFEASSFFDATGEQPRVGQFYFVIDPSAFAADDEEEAETVFLERMAALMTAYTDQPGTRVPGARRFELRAKAQAGGVNVDDGLLAELEARASK